MVHFFVHINKKKQHFYSSNVRLHLTTLTNVGGQYPVLRHELSEATVTPDPLCFLFVHTSNLHHSFNHLINMHPDVCHTSSPDPFNIQTVVCCTVYWGAALLPEEEVVGFGRATNSEIKVQSVPRVCVQISTPEKEACPFKNKAVQQGNGGLKADGKTAF